MARERPLLRAPRTHGPYGVSESEREGRREVREAIELS